jgi:hypothetical protein
MVHRHLTDNVEVNQKTIGSCRFYAIFRRKKVVDPVEYITKFDEVPYMVAVAAETMGIATHKQAPCVFSPTELVDRAESAIYKYPVHAYEIGLVTLAMLADGIIPDTPGRLVLREQFVRIGDAIQDAENDQQAHRT